jgi:hypothetical protein
MAVLFVEGAGAGRVDDVIDMSGRHKTVEVKLVIVEFSRIQRHHVPGNKCST